MRLPTLLESSWLRYGSFFYLYFMQGVPSGFALTALVNYLTGQHVSPAIIGTFISIVGFPWVIQLIWGPFIDRYRYSVVGHYKHWVVLTQVAAVAASLLLLVVRQPHQQIWLLAALFCTHSIVASIQDASVDAMAILITPPNEQGRVNAFMRGGILLGASFGAAGLSTVLHAAGYHAAVLVQSGILLFFTLIFFFTKLHRTDPLFPKFGSKPKGNHNQGYTSLRAVFRQLAFAFFKKGSLLISCVIGLSYTCFSIFIRSINMYLILQLQWTDRELSVLSGTWSALVTLLVVMSSGLFADRFGPTTLQRFILLLLSVFLISFNLLLFQFSNKTMVTAGLLFWGVADPLYSIAAFPILMKMSKKEIAGSQFTAYMALINLCDIGGAFITGLLIAWLPGPAIGLASGILLLLLTVILFRHKSRFVPVQG